MLFLLRRTMADAPCAGVSPPALEHGSVIATVEGGLAIYSCDSGWTFRDPSSGFSNCVDDVWTTDIGECFGMYEMKTSDSWCLNHAILVHVMCMLCYEFTVKSCVYMR